MAFAEGMQGGAAGPQSGRAAGGRPGGRAGGGGGGGRNCGVVAAAAPPAATASTAASSGSGTADTAGSGASSSSSSSSSNYYTIGRTLGHGSFGVVCEARCMQTGETVAIKKVLQDPRYKNRELDVMKAVRHPNVVALKDYFYTVEENAKVIAAAGGAGGAGGGAPSVRELPVHGTSRFLNVVMDFLPETVHRVVRGYTKYGSALPLPYVRVYIYQLLRSVAYLHALGICHRDIKPQNLLVDTLTHKLKICDFGSAKRLTAGEPSVSYICSRFYRAPELMLGATEYSSAIDIWSVGCVLAELLLGKPVFVGETSIDQLVKIIQIRGTPSKREMLAMNPKALADEGGAAAAAAASFPTVSREPWRSVFAAGAEQGRHVPDSVFPLLDALLRYSPAERATAYEALASTFFDPLRENPEALLPQGQPMPQLFNFSEFELQSMGPELRAILLPAHATVAPTGPPAAAGDDDEDDDDVFEDEDGEEEEEEEEDETIVTSSSQGPATDRSIDRSVASLESSFLRLLMLRMTKFTSCHGANTAKDFLTLMRYASKSFSPSLVPAAEAIRWRPKNSHRGWPPLPGPT